MIQQAALTGPDAVRLNGEHRESALDTCSIAVACYWVAMTRRAVVS